MASKYRLMNVRMTQEQILRLKSAARRENKTLSAWVRDELDKAARIPK